MLSVAYSLALIALTVSANPQTKPAPSWPLMRQTNYLALLPKAGEELRLEIKSRQVSKQYSDELHYSLLAVGRTLTNGQVGLAKEQLLTVKPQSSDLLALELVAGHNGCTVDAGSMPVAYIASEFHPLHIVGVNGPFYFYVPQGCRRFAILLAATAPREGVRLVVRTPDGQIAKEEEGDFDAPARIALNVPKSGAGQVWSLSFERPKDKRLHADDTTITLDSNIAPYLTQRADWALEFGKRRHP